MYLPGDAKISRESKARVNDQEWSRDLCRQELHGGPGPAGIWRAASLGYPGWQRGRAWGAHESRRLKRSWPGWKKEVSPLHFNLR